MMGRWSGIRAGEAQVRRSQYTYTLNGYSVDLQQLFDSPERLVLDGIFQLGCCIA